MANKLSSLLQTLFFGAHISRDWQGILADPEEKQILNAATISASEDVNVLLSPDPQWGFLHLKPTEKKWLILGRIDWFLALNLNKITSRKGELHVHVDQTRRGTSRHTNCWLVVQHGGK